VDRHVWHAAGVDSDPRHLRTARLQLRPLVLADVPAIVRFRDDPEVARYQSWDRYSEADAQALVASVSDGRPGTAGEWFQWGIELAAGPGAGALIGDCGLKTHDDPRLGDIGYTLGRAHQRQGYASEAVRRIVDLAFTSLGMHRISASIDADNHASLALCERLGMRREAHHRRSVWFKGAWCDDVIYAVLRDEWVVS
jgi:aminoglycoside 6'-N-acetyltransferase